MGNTAHLCSDKARVGSAVLILKMITRAEMVEEGVMVEQGAN